MYVLFFYNETQGAAYVKVFIISQMKYTVETHMNLNDAKNWCFYLNNLFKDNDSWSISC